MGISRVITVHMFAAASALLIAGVASAAPTAGGKDEFLIGYVDFVRARVEVNEGKRAIEQLKGQFEKKQKELSDREAKVKKMDDDLKKESVIKMDEATQKKKEELQQQVLELQQIFIKEQKELQEAEAKVASTIGEKMRKVIAEIGEQGGYTLILESSSSRMLFAKPHLDLTNEVIRKYNAKHK
jgi:outer membrane protein